MSMHKQNFNYVNKDGKTVKGAAAVLHQIYTVCGGVENFIKSESPKGNKNNIKSFFLWIPNMFNKRVKKPK